MVSPTPNRRVARAPWVALALLALLALSMVPAAARAQQFVSYFEPSACPVEFQEELTVDCGYVVVPESHNNFDGTVLRIATAVVRSPNPNKAPDPLVYMMGGPGGASLPFGPGLVERLAPVLLSRDLILYDQRGTGFSEPRLLCPSSELELLDRGVPRGLLPTQDTPPELLAFADEVAACLQANANAGAKLRYYNTAENAADVEDIRRALGLGQINLHGTSYGTRLGLEVLRYRPETIRSAVFDSNSPPQADDLTTGTFSGLNNALNRLAAACSAEATCGSAFGDIGADFETVVTRLNNAPAVLPIYDLENDVIIDYLPITGVDFTIVTFNFMYSTRLMPLMPAFISLTADGNYELLSLFVSALLTPGGDGGDSDVVFWSIVCTEEAVGLTATDFVRARDQNRRTANLAFFLQSNEALLGACAGAELTTSYPGASDPVSSSVPTFLIAGAFDPITPLENVYETGDTLSNDSIAVYPRGGHVPSFFSPCLTLAVAQFIDDPTATPDTSCIAQEVIPFVSPETARATAFELENSGSLLQLLRQRR